MNNTMVPEIRGKKINPKSSFKNWGGQNTRGGNYASKYGKLKYLTKTEYRRTKTTEAKFHVVVHSVVCSTRSSRERHYSVCCCN